MDISGTSENGGMGGRGGEDIGGPIEKSVPIFYEIGKRSNNWVAFKTIWFFVCGIFGRSGVEVKV